MTLKRGQLFIVSAPSGAGKTTLVKAAVDRLNADGVPSVMSVSYTTRAPRPGEQDGVDYHFVSKEVFDQMVKDFGFLEHAEVFGRSYGTGREATEKALAHGMHVLLDIDWQGGRQVRHAVPNAVSIFVLPPSLEELERRLRGRGQDSEEEVQKRMAEAAAEMAHYKEYQHVVVNVNFDKALDEFVHLVKSGGESRSTDHAKSFIEKLLG